MDFQAFENLNIPPLLRLPDSCSTSSLSPHGSPFDKIFLTEFKYILTCDYCNFNSIAIKSFNTLFLTIEKEKSIQAALDE